MTILEDAIVPLTTPCGICGTDDVLERGDHGILVCGPCAEVQHLIFELELRCSVTHGKSEDPTERARLVAVSKAADQFRDFIVRPRFTPTGDPVR